MINHILRRASVLCSRNQKCFGIISEYNERANKKLTGTHQLLDKPHFFVTPTRPSNFEDHIDVKVTIDNWFDENRVHNQHQTDIRRTQSYTIASIYYAGIGVFACIYAAGVISKVSGWTKYDPNTYMELDISELPPGEVMQIVWNGTPVFVRRLTDEQINQENHYPTSTVLDPDSQVILTRTGNSSVLVVSALCTHLGCIPIPYMGAYNGWVCICHGSVYDKMGRVRQGPALKNLPTINNSIYQNGTLLCMQQMKKPREPSQLYWT